MNFKIMLPNLLFLFPEFPRIFIKLKISNNNNNNKDPIIQSLCPCFCNGSIILPSFWDPRAATPLELPRSSQSATRSTAVPCAQTSSLSSGLSREGSLPVVPVPLLPLFCPSRYD